jgi:hypothetical protein
MPEAARLKLFTLKKSRKHEIDTRAAEVLSFSPLRTALWARGEPRGRPHWRRRGTRRRGHMVSVVTGRHARWSKNPSTGERARKTRVIRYRREGGGERVAQPCRRCCRSKPTGEQRQATRGAGRLPGLLVGPDPLVNGPRSGTLLAFGLLGVPPDLVPDQEGVIC